MATSGVVQDRAWAWVVCASSFLILVLQGGLVYSMGVLYIMFQDGLEGASDGALSLVTSLNYSVLYLVCPLVGMVTERIGERRLAIAGATLATAGIACSAFAVKVFHLYLAYSLMGGVGMGMVFNPSMSILAKYFDKYRKVAAGIAVCGNGVGAIIFPAIINALEDAHGWRGALLLLAGIYAQVIMLCCLYRPVEGWEEHCAALKGDPDLDMANGVQHLHADVKCETLLSTEGEIQTDFTNDGNGEHVSGARNLAKRTSSVKKTTAKEDDLRTVVVRSLWLFRIVPFMCLCIHSSLTLFPTVLVYTHFGRYVLTLGYSTSDVVLLYMAMGITSTISRVGLGVIAEVANANSSLLVMSSALMNGVLTCLLPLVFTGSVSMLYTYAVVFVVFLAPYNVLCLPLTMESVPKTLVAMGYGIVCFFCVPGTAFGAPLAAWLHSVTQMYASSFYLAGTLFIMSGLIMIPALHQSCEGPLGSKSQVNELKTSKEHTEC